MRFWNAQKKCLFNPHPRAVSAALFNNNQFNKNRMNYPINYQEIIPKLAAKFNGMQVFEFEAKEYHYCDYISFAVRIPVYFVSGCTDADKRKLKKQRLNLDCSNLETKDPDADQPTPENQQAVFVQIALFASISRVFGSSVCAYKHPKVVQSGKVLKSNKSPIVNEQKFASIIDAALACLYNNNIVFDDIVSKFKKF